MIGTEHLLLGLLSEEDGVAPKVLMSTGLDAAALRSHIELAVGQGQPKDKLVDLPLTPRAKRVLDVAMRKAKSMGMNYVGTEHLFLGILNETDGMAVTVLTELGVDLQRVAQDVEAGLMGTVQEAPEATVKPAMDLSRKGGVSKTPTLDQVGIDLSERAKRGELDPVIGRGKEIQRLVQILSRRTKNNPVLMGDPGVGKTAIVEGLAQRIVAGDIPEVLRGKRVVQLNVGNLIAGTKYRGEFEERMRRLVKELSESKSVVLFIDEIHTIVGAGGAEGAVDAANILKPSLARGEFQVIGATTMEEYRKYVEKDAALERRFQPIQVEEPSEEDTVKILEGLRDRYEAHHRAKITDDALLFATRLSARYITERFLPDKAIDVIDEAAARARISTMDLPEEIKELERRLELIRQEKEVAVGSEDFEAAARLKTDEMQLGSEIENRRRAWQIERNQVTPVVDKEDIAYIVAQWTGIPLVQLTEEEASRLLRMEGELHKRMVGQDEALSAVARAVRRARSGLKDPQRPVGSFLFLGPTGVGKTELARALAEFMFGSQDAMIRLDMSEYMERHEVAKLIGAPPGYVGFEEGGKLTEAVRRRPYCVILFDEIEKASPDVFNILLQLLEDGRLTDGQGHAVDFRNTIIIMTSNAGASDIQKGQSLGFSIGHGEEGKSKTEWLKMKDTIMESVRRIFRPEFLNRVDDIVVFRALEREELLKIVDLMLQDVTRRAAQQNVTLDIADATRQFLLEKGFDPKYGARPLRRTIQRMVEDRLADLMLEGVLTAGDGVRVDLEEAELVFQKQE